jgi:glycosyltransferase involved in cell wall biosynthesis
MPMDPVVAFLPTALSAASRLVVAEKPDAIYVSAYPYSALVLGALLKRRHGVPLVCELRDPWTMNVEFRPRHPAVAAFERRLERWVFEIADRVVVTTDAVRDAYAELYPQLRSERLRRIYSSYDEGLAPGEAVEVPDGPLTIIHFGSMYGPRRALPLLRAMARLRDERKLGSGAVRFLVFGRLDNPDDHAAIRSLGLEGDVTVSGKIPYAEGMAALRRADVLYLPAFGDETFYIPGKLYDYFMAGRPILCETASSELERILARTGTGVCVRLGDEDAVLGYLRQALDARTGGPPLARPVRSEIERFSASAVTAELGALLDEVVGGGPRAR